jgi:hypothetical protein
MPAAKASPPVYELKVTLLGIEPPIWRRIQAPSTIRLCCLHDVLQSVMGWCDSHLHQFERNGAYWGVPNDDAFEGDIEVIDESGVRLDSILSTQGESMVYVYDLGDNWRHEIVLERIVPSDTPTKPVCLDGQRHCPPEDVGGPHGYEEFLNVIFEPGHEQFDHYRRWAGEPVHAEEFSVGAVNDVLSKMRFPLRHRR